MTDESANEAPPEHLVNFACGHPDASLLPVREVQQATQLVLQSSGQEWLQYGHENGNPTARQALAKFLSKMYGDDLDNAVTPSTLCLTSGVSHSIQLACRALHRLYSTTEAASQIVNHKNNPPLCLVEDPTYFLVPDIFLQAGYEVEAVATNPVRGLDVVALEIRLQELRKEFPTRLIVLYTIPIHHNPLGVSLPEGDRQKLVALCDTYCIYVIADEVYHGLSWDKTTVTKPMALRSPQIISCSAFTKLLCPGVRCGWIQSNNEKLLQTICKDAVLYSGGCTSQLSSGIVSQLIGDRTMDAIVTKLQSTYQSRCQHLCQLLQSNTSVKFKLQVPQGGYFVWVQPVGVPWKVDNAFRKYCKQHHDVDFLLAASCSHNDTSDHTWFSNYMRLCFAYYDIPKLTVGVERLCQAIEAYTNERMQKSSAL